MKKLFFLISFITFLSNGLLANGVVLNKALAGSYLTLLESSVSVSIENQVAITQTTQIFKNNIGDSLTIKYAFPLPEDASATNLRYKINGKWYTANFAPVPQDTTTGGSTGDFDYTLNQYLGPNPLYFEIDQQIRIDSLIIVELSYVELLKYKFGKVNYNYPNDYHTIQTEIINKQEIYLELISERTIETIELLSHSATESENSGSLASISYIGYELSADADYRIQYSLSLSELGLYSLSTYLPDSIQKDDFGRGFFSFIVEPDPTENTDVIEKVFTLIIDNSGSMSGNKMVQAREAAKFIVQNLNEGDKFNVISFSTEVTGFRSGHVDYTISNQDAAFSYINSLTANGSTNISGAFDVAIPQFSVADASKANIIIFFTDGQQTAGITDTDQLISHINNLIIQSEKRISLFTFGIGSSTNARLLTSIADSNNGLSEFLANSELESVITEFYLIIRNPVLLNTEIEFSPSIITEYYPVRLPNLYKGQQLILIGRYNEPSLLTTKLIGKSFTNNIEYSYNTNLSDSLNTNLQFLTKIWAKSKIDHLMDQYYLNSNNPTISDSIKNSIIKLSLDYGVVSPFTSFQGGEEDNGWISVNIERDAFETEEINSDKMSNQYISIESIYPNPALDFVSIMLSTKNETNGILSIKLINTKGQMVYQQNKLVNSNSKYEFSIDILNMEIESGVYYFTFQFKGEMISCKIVIN
ncbi:MAG: VWA domain-containing protein [Bacteroidales bacterium]|nr:VWA domain-containing protein [Bacteroidales bacterium]